MPKPTRAEVHRVYTTAGPGDSLAVDALMRLIDASWEQDEAERERGRTALEVAERYGRHHPSCDWFKTDRYECSCGLDAALAQLRGESPDPQSSATATADAEPPKPAEWEYATGDTAAPWEHDVDAFNREQMARREAYAQGMMAGDITSRKGDVLNGFCRAEAARRYPLKKAEPRIIPDPHPYHAGQWCVVNLPTRRVAYRSSFLKKWSLDGEFPSLTEDRLRALAALLDSPFTYVDDTTPEQENT